MMTCRRRRPVRVGGSKPVLVEDSKPVQVEECRRPRP